jgi:hypothetical protein
MVDSSSFCGPLHDRARVVLTQFGQHTAGQFDRIAIGQCAGHGTNRQRARRKRA